MVGMWMQQTRCRQDRVIVSISWVLLLILVRLLRAMLWERLFHGTVAAAWLAENAPTYGFRLSYPAGQEWVTGYAHESWHWRWWSE
ncbi:D-alanyl-D-alanine carboxypeptidase family protein [Candidatus Nomurabacteria bacterium]|nr:D-alanyl-D-alanine carboxypeptidase family protein [Candidatus Nomurabacteria bacterium]